MVDWNSAEGARRGHDIRREQAEAQREEKDGIEKTDIYRVDCPHCGVPAGGMCEETGPFGRTGTYRSPHPERRELAREVTEYE